MERIISYTRSALLWGVITGTLFLSSCYQRIIRSDTATSGIARIVVDDNLAPIVEAGINVFESLNRDATLLSGKT